MHDRSLVVRLHVAFGLLVLTLGLAAVVRAQVDPQSLMGEWTGEWRSKSNPSYTNGTYLLTIEKVQGDKVFGQGEARGRQVLAFKIAGTLQGSRLTYRVGDVTTELVVEGTRMNGGSSGGRAGASDITLSKK